MMNIRLLLLALAGISFACRADKVNKTLYINSGLFTTVDSHTFPCLAFNETPAFSAQNSVIHLTTNDTLILTMINQDSVTHHFSVKGLSLTGNVIAATDSITVSLDFKTEGVYLYYDNYQYPKYRYMGLGGMICVSNSLSAKQFYWNLKEHQKEYNQTLLTNGNVSWSDYYPDYFTINGLSHPDLQNDSTARIHGSVGDTILIYIVNTGQSSHAIHFHGFHCRVVYSTSKRVMKNAVKDTFPIESMEGLVLEMVPDKVGKYSVHDHNLVAVSGGGKHPNGMFIIMEIQ